jgi:hypothetical protein
MWRCLNPYGIRLQIYFFINCSEITTDYEEPITLVNFKTP